MSEKEIDVVVRLLRQVFHLEGHADAIESYIKSLDAALSFERQAREKAEKALEYMTLKAKGACGKCKFDSESLRAEIASTKDDLRVMTDLYHSNRRCQCSDEDCCAYEREKEALRAELTTLRDAAQRVLDTHLTGECVADLRQALSATKKEAR